METRDVDAAVTTLLRAMRENIRNDPDKAVKCATAFNLIVTAIGQDGLETIWGSYDDVKE
jgi:hypothetical protein